MLLLFKDVLFETDEDKRINLIQNAKNQNGFFSESNKVRRSIVKRKINLALQDLFIQ